MANREKLCRIGFVTNGMLLSSKLVDNIVEMGVDWVDVSLDCIGKVHDDIRVGSNFNQIKQNILYLMRKRGGNCKPEVNISFTETQWQTPEEREAFVKYWLGKVDIVRRGVCFDSNARAIDASYFTDAESEMVTLPACVSPCFSMGVLWDGRVAACCADISGQTILGNVCEQSLKEIWKDQKIKKLRYDLLRGKPQEPLCKTCNAWRTIFRWKTVPHNNYYVTYTGYHKLCHQTESVPQNR